MCHKAEPPKGKKFKHLGIISGKVAFKNIYLKDLGDLSKSHFLEV